jgi:hypothetical protein
MNAHISRLASAALFAGLIAVHADPANATSGGIVGYNTTRDNAPCAGCHSPNTALNVSITGPAAVLPGQTVQYTVAVNGFSSGLAGFNAAVSKNAQQPTFTAGAGETQVTGDTSTQIAHGSGGKKSNPASWVVNLTMPPGAVLGTNYTLYVTGNAGAPGGFGYDSGTNLVVTVAPPTPTSLTANQATATATQISLTWAGTQGEQFKVMRKTGSYSTSASDGTLVYEGANTSANATGLTAGTTYFFSAFGRSPTSASYSAQAAQATAGTLPPNPTGLTATPAGSTEINLSWIGTSAEFLVLRKTGTYPTSPTDGTATTVHNGAGTSKLDTGLSSGTAYFYRVWGKTAGSSAFSTANSQATASTTSNPIDRHVSSGSGNDQSGANDCSAQGTPCKTITRAMAASGSGDAIYVVPGTYNLASGEVFPIVFKSGIRLMATGNATNTIIDAAGDTVKNGIFNSSGNNSSQARIEGFTIRNGLKHPLTFCDSPLGGALYITGGTGTFTVTRNVFENNESRGYSPDGSGGATGCLAWGGAIAVFSHTVHVTNNIFVGNIARGGSGLSTPGQPFNVNAYGGQGMGGAVYFAGQGSIANNTFHGNSARGGNGGIGNNGSADGGPAISGAVNVSGSPVPGVYNNIFVANFASSGTGGTPEPATAGAILAAGSPSPFTKNLFFGNLVNGGASSGDTLGSSPVNADPLFHSAPANLHILTGSPAASAGTTPAPTTDLDGVTRPNPPAIGAYEPTAIVPPNPARLVNLSTRNLVQTGDNVLIGGFVIGGSTNKTVVVRARGPSLAQFGVPGALANPQMQLFQGQSQIGFNDNWKDTQQAAIQASGQAPENDLESAILVTLAPGLYSAIVTGVGNTSGIGIIEIFEIDQVNTPLINISSRGPVFTGDNVMIGGFIIQGDGPQTVLVRARGPSLAQHGVPNVLANPQMQLFQGPSPIGFNDNWKDSQQVAIQASGFAPENDLESAILVTLQPGAYSAIVTGVAGGTGNAIVEIFKVN